jgi:hypothetical protein
VSTIVHAVKPPGYRNWDQLVLPMLDNSLVAARAVGAGVALPGTIYNCNPRKAPVAVESSPQYSQHALGKIRAEMERQHRGMVKSLMLCAGDFFGPESGSSCLSRGMVTPGKRLNFVLYPGARGVGHN